MVASKPASVSLILFHRNRDAVQLWLFRLAVTSAGFVDEELSLGSFLQPAGRLICEICDDDVGARTLDARQNF